MEGCAMRRVGGLRRCASARGDPARTAKIAARVDPTPGYLADLPAQRLARGQVGTVVEQLDDKTLLVEFSDDQGRAYAVAPCQRADLLILHYVPEAA